MIDNKKFQRYIDIAKSLYEKDSDCRCQHFTIITVKNRIISIGRNSRKTSSFNLHNPKIGNVDGKDITSTAGTCSESNAIKRIINTTNIPLRKTKMFIVRVNNNLEIAGSRPCFSCSSLIRFFQPKEVYYTTNQGTWERF